MGAAQKPKEQRVSQTASIPAPVGGLNARDALANMPATDAIIMDNWFPQPTWVEVRKGSSTLATYTGLGESLMAYNYIDGTNQLFCAVNNAGNRSIYRVDNVAGGGAVGAPVVGWNGAGNTLAAITSTRYDWAQYGTGSGEWLYVCNDSGADNLLIYNGAAWQVVTGVSAPIAITGVNTNLLSYVAVYKQRAWFIQQNSFTVWYLPQNSVGGAALSINLAPNFKLGGKLVSIVTVSIDNASGTNDYIAFVSNQGEVVVFNGYDPASVSTWSVAAHFRIGRPLANGRRTWQKMGSDALLVGMDGFILMSEALLTDRSQTRNAVSDKIRKSVTDSATQYATNFGWQAILYPVGNKVLINVPTAATTSFAYVMNTLNNSWCTFGQQASSWNAICYELMGDNLYCSGNGSVMQVDTGTADNGSAISATLKTSFNYFESHGDLKRWTMARPIFTVTGSVQVGLFLNVDYDATASTSTIPISSGNSAVWNVSLWSTPTYWGDATTISKRWIGVGGIGYSAALNVRVSANGVGLALQSVDYVYEKGGPLG